MKKVEWGAELRARRREFTLRLLVAATLWAVPAGACDLKVAVFAPSGAESQMAKEVMWSAALFGKSGMELQLDIHAHALHLVLDRVAFSFLDPERQPQLFDVIDAMRADAPPHDFAYVFLKGGKRGNDGEIGGFGSQRGLAVSLLPRYGVRDFRKHIAHEIGHVLGAQHSDAEMLSRTKATIMGSWERPFTASRFSAANVETMRQGCLGLLNARQP